MNYLKTYLKTIADRGNVDLAHSIEQTATEIGDRYIQDFNFCEHRIGLLFGNVQSGKTGQMFGIITKATDMGFPAFVLLTTDNVVLQQQTLERVQNDLSGYCICGENDSGLFIQNSLMKPAIIVLKKNSRILRLWANVFASTGFMKGNPLFIVDDEADAASLNTLINRNRQSSINRYLDSIKNGASSSIYLQVTGTPQAISILEMMLSEKPNAQGMLIVRRNRDVAQGTGALLSPNDWALGGQHTASTVLTMYKVTGKKGWGGQELWVPNIKLPNGLIYYDVQEDDSST